MGFRGLASVSLPKQPRLSPTRHRLGVTASQRPGPAARDRQGRERDRDRGCPRGGYRDGATHSSCTAAELCCAWGSGASAAGTRDKRSPGEGIGVLAAAQYSGQDRARQGVPQQAGGSAVGSTGPAWNDVSHPELGPHRS